MVIKAVHIWIFTSFLEVPMKALICNNSLIFRMNTSISYLDLYRPPMVQAIQVMLTLISFIVCWFSSSHIATFLSLDFYLVLDNTKKKETHQGYYWGVQPASSLIELHRLDIKSRKDTRNAACGSLLRNPSQVTVGSEAGGQCA